MPTLGRAGVGRTGDTGRMGREHGKGLATRNALRFQGGGALGTLGTQERVRMPVISDAYVIYEACGRASAMDRTRRRDRTQGRAGRGGGTGRGGGPDGGAGPAEGAGRTRRGAGRGPATAGGRGGMGWGPAAGG